MRAHRKNSRPKVSRRPWAGGAQPADLRRVVEFIRKNDNFLITTHVNVEGDALGSELAFLGLLRKFGKRGIIVNDEGVPPEYRFLPGAERIIPYADARRVRFDCCCVLDCSDASRTGRVWSLVGGSVPVLNIDHHVSNRRFARVNWIEPGFSSCSEQIFTLYKTMRLALDRAAAVNLYTGIMTDTGSFRFSNTSARTHLAVGEIMRFPLDPSDIYRRMYESVPYEDIRFLISVHGTLKSTAGGRIVWFEIGSHPGRAARNGWDLTEKILSFGRSIRGVQVVLLFRQTKSHPPQVRVNFRSSGVVDVNAVAACFGGGGHPTASGATVAGTLASVERRVVREVRKRIPREKVSSE